MTPIPAFLFAEAKMPQASNHTRKQMAIHIDIDADVDQRTEQLSKVRRFIYNSSQ